jgi:hypothetical protein
MDQPTVKVGQIWADNDKRAGKRTVRVDKIAYEWRSVGGGFHDKVPVALCTVLTDKFGGRPTPDRHVSIQVSRMRPTSTGYRLVSEGAKDGAR